MTIISDAQLISELPSGYTSAKVTTSVNRASRLVNTWATHYEEFPDSDATVTAPDEIVHICMEVAKAIYFLSIGQVNRDGNENENLNQILVDSKAYLQEIQIEPTVASVAISLDSNGVQLIARNQHILRWHPLCRVVSGSSSIWNQYYHWDIRKGTDSTDEQFDGWYFDAEQYKSTIEGTLYYARSWRNDSLDYQKYRHKLVA